VNGSALHAVSLAAAEERSVEGVLQRTVDGLARHPGVVGACIWLLAPDASCPICARKNDRERDARPSLHMVAIATPGEREREAQVGRSAHRLGLDEAPFDKPGLDTTLVVNEAASAQRWAGLHADLLERDQVQSFGLTPIKSHGKLLGVLGVFSRVSITPEDMAQLRQLAEQVAVSMLNSRAFAEVEARAAELHEENGYLREEVAAAAGPAGIIGNSEPLHRALQQAALVAEGTSAVLISGESGTGKELFARFIHEHSPRRDRPLIKVNCSSIPHTLFESEFFGHVKGSFTGAVRDRLGRFRLADKGTIFLDEVSEIPLELQPKLLRVLQEGEFERVGEDKTTRVDVRVISATNRDLPAWIAERKFRDDLYYRLALFPLQIPPLRERGDDILLLAEHFAEAARRRANRPRFRITDADLRALQAYAWPGNVRELSSVIERAAILSPDGKHVDIAALLAAPVARPQPSRIVSDREWRELERENLVAALEKANWKVSGAGGAAQLLGMKASTLSSRLRALGVRRPGNQDG